MPEIKIPTVKEFKGLTGRSGFGRIFKTKSDLNDIFSALNAVHGAAPLSPQEIPSIRGLRCACIAWLSAGGASERASFGAVGDLLTRAHARFVSAAELRNFGAQASSGAAVPIKNIPNLPFGRDITARSGQARDVKRVGNQLRASLEDETKSRHWGPNVARPMKAEYGLYKNSGGLLSIGAWADHIYLPTTEDDPTGLYLRGGKRAVSANLVAEGVTYCTPEERKAYRISIQGGRLHEAGGALYDTTPRMTHFSKYGWAIFVLGFDNILYSNTHIVDKFHHSSFFAGEPVQCGGEICCIGGKVRYLTSKTGHYASGKFEFYRLLNFMRYQGVDLANVLACPTVHEKRFDWYRASDVFGAHGSAPIGAEIVKKGQPKQLKEPGEPEWPGTMPT